MKTILVAILTCLTVTSLAAEPQRLGTREMDRVVAGGCVPGTGVCYDTLSAPVSPAIGPLGPRIGFLFVAPQIGGCIGAGECSSSSSAAAATDAR